MKKGLAVAMAALLGVATMGTTAMAAASGDITICSREDGSGTRGAFIELFGIEEIFLLYIYQYEVQALRHR